MAEPINCGECGAPMVLKRSPRFGLFFGCTRWPHCTGTHGAHQQTRAPLGTPANKETKQARIEAHRLFDKLWKADDGKLMTRGAAYRWMQEELGLSKDDAHIGKFDVATCDRLKVAVRRVLESAGRRRT